MNLKELSDQELFKVTIELGKEIRYRILKLLKENNCTIYYFTDDTPFVRISKNLYKKDEYEETIEVIAVGYMTLNDNSNFVFIVDNNDTMYYEDSLCDDLWDVYKILKDDIEDVN